MCAFLDLFTSLHTLRAGRKSICEADRRAWWRFESKTSAQLECSVYEHAENRAGKGRERKVTYGRCESTLARFTFQHRLSLSLLFLFHHLIPSPTRGIPFAHSVPIDRRFNDPHTVDWPEPTSLYLFPSHPSSASPRYELFQDETPYSSRSRPRSSRCPAKA